MGILGHTSSIYTSKICVLKLLNARYMSSAEETSERPNILQPQLHRLLAAQDPPEPGSDALSQRLNLHFIWRCFFVHCDLLKILRFSYSISCSHPIRSQSEQPLTLIDIVWWSSRKSLAIQPTTLKIHEDTIQILSRA